MEENKEEWIKLSEAHKRYGIPIPTLKDWVTKGVLEYKQFIKKKGSPRYIKPIDIPAFKRKQK